MAVYAIGDVQGAYVTDGINGHASAAMTGCGSSATSSIVDRSRSRCCASCTE